MTREAFSPAMLQMPQLLIPSPYPAPPQPVPFASPTPLSQPSTPVQPQRSYRTLIADQSAKERQHRWVDDPPHRHLSDSASASPSLHPEAVQPPRRLHRRPARPTSASSQRRQRDQGREQRRIQRAAEERQRRSRRHTPHPAPAREEEREEKEERAASEPLPMDRWSRFVRSLRPSARADPPRLWSLPNPSQSQAELGTDRTALSDVDASASSMQRPPPQAALETDSASSLSPTPAFPRARPSDSLWSKAALLPLPTARRRPRRQHRPPPPPPPPPHPPFHQQSHPSPPPHYHLSPPVVYQREEPPLLWSPSPPSAPPPPPSTLWSHPTSVHQHRPLISPSHHPHSAPSYARLMPLPSEVVRGGGGGEHGGRSPPPVFLPLRSGKTAIEWCSDDEHGRGVVAVVDGDGKGGWEGAEEASASVPFRLWKAAPQRPTRAAISLPRAVRQEVRADLGETQLLQVAKAINQQAAGGAAAADGVATSAESARVDRGEGTQPVTRSAAVQTVVEVAPVPAMTVEAQVEAELRRMREKVALYISGRRTPAPPHTPPPRAPHPSPLPRAPFVPPPPPDLNDDVRRADAQPSRRQLELEAAEMAHRMAALVAAPPTPRGVPEVSVHDRLRPVPLPPEVGRKLELLKKGRERREAAEREGGLGVKGEQQLYEEAQGLIARFRKEFDTAAAQAHTPML